MLTDVLCWSGLFLLDTQYVVYVWSIRPDVDRCVVLVRVVPAGHPVRGVRVECKT